MDANRIGRVRGAKDMPYTDGVICGKVSRYGERQHHPDRLTKPLIRTGPKGSGDFREATWEEALDRVAEAFQEAAKDFGPESVWPYQYAGTMGLVQRRSIMRLTRAMGYSAQEETICTAAGKTGWMAGVGRYQGVDPREMDQADRIVVWGGNPASTQVNAWRHMVKARKARGIRVIVVDPYATRSARGADWHLALKPGTDGALATAMIGVILREGLADRDFLSRMTDFDEKAEAHFLSRTPEWAAGITGLPADDIVRFAREVAASKKTFYRVGYGFSRGRSGSVNMHAVTCLPAITGAWTEVGGGALFSMSGLYNWDFSAIDGADLTDRTPRTLDMSHIGAILMGEAWALQGGGPVKAMLIQNTNPASVAPETAKVVEGFRREDLFVCVHEQFMTDTARLADVVLPATTFLEHDDLYSSGGHTFVQVARALLTPLADARPNRWVIAELARRLGVDDEGFRRSTLDVMEETLSRTGLPGLAEIENPGWYDAGKTFADHHHSEGFGHADGRFHFYPDWPSQGRHEASRLPLLPDHSDVWEGGDRDHPYRLMTSPGHDYLNSTFTETPSSQKAMVRPCVLMTQQDANRENLMEGDRVRLGNKRGSVLVHVKIADAQQSGILVVESIWPNEAFEEGLGINTLVGADPVLPGGGAAFHDVACWLRAAP